MSLDEMLTLIDLAHQYDFVIVSDECYSELYYDDAHVPHEQLPSTGRLCRKPSSCLSLHAHALEPTRTTVALSPATPRLFSSF